MASGSGREFRVGIFVTALVVAAGVVIFVLGGSTDMLANRYRLNGSWADVAGLKEGAVVRLAGWDVGEVSSIKFSDDLGVKEIFVEMSIKSRYQARIRKDSEARIDTVGVLGDKYVSITMGDPGTPELEDGDWIDTSAPLDIVTYTRQMTDILTSAASISHKLDLMLGTDQEAARGSLSASFQHVEEMLQAAKEGSGLLHALVYDEQLTGKTHRILDNLEAMSENAQDVTDEIRTGDGLANELVYGDDGAALALQLRQLADALSQLAADIKNEDSLVHVLLYDPEKAKILDDLAVTAASLRATSEAIESGDGTIGLLARDPALYEDLRAIVGGAQRNKLLRAYIRKTVQASEADDAASWTPPE